MADSPVGHSNSPELTAPGKPRPPAEIELTHAPAAQPEQDAGPLWQHSEPLLPAETPTEVRDSGSPRRKRIVLGAALAVGLLGAAAIGTVGWRVASQSDATLTTPEQVAGLVRDDSERARETAEYLRIGVAADIELDDSFGVVYADPAARDRSVMLFGGTGLLWQPGRDLDRLLELVAADAGTIGGVRELPAGQLGGVMKCGSTPAEEGALTICGWADHGSVVLAMFPGRSVDESAELLREIRATIQTRG